MRFFAVLSVSAVFLAALAPAVFAQAETRDDGDDGNASVQYVDCSQVQIVFANQGQYGDANAAADDESEAVAEISQELNISQNQVNACLGSIGGGGGDNNTPDPTDDGNGGDRDDDEDDAASAAEMREGEDEVIKGTVLAKELPNTGGPSLLGGVLGLALVAGGAALIRSRR